VEPAPKSIGCFQYYVSFIDDFSNFLWNYFLKNISEVLACSVNRCEEANSSGRLATVKSQQQQPLNLNFQQYVEHILNSQKILTIQID
jgi:hypothetical protein